MPNLLWAASLLLPTSTEKEAAHFNVAVFPAILRNGNFMSYYFLVLSILGVWRVTHLLNQEAGPSDIFTRLRRVAGSGFFGRLLDCFYCLSLWIALPFAALIGHTWVERFLLWSALSGAAILLEKFSSKALPASAGYYEEDPEANHVLR